jgi:putative ABC transport system permease protein
MLRLHGVERGFDPRNLLTMQTHLENRNYETIADSGRDMKRMLPSVDLFYGRLLDRVSRLPGVEAAAYSSTGYDERTFTVLGHPPPPESGRPTALYSEVSPSYFGTMRIPLRMGRVFDENDRAGAAWTLVLDETFARRYFPGENPVGKSVRRRIEHHRVEEDRPRVIVGVVGAVKSWARMETAQPLVYTSNLQQPELFPGGSGWQHRLRRLIVRTRGDVRAQTAPLAAAVKSMVAEMDKEIPVTHVKTMEFILQEQDQDTRSFAILLTAFGLLAAFLAACGIYGVMSYQVAERTREVGLRVALGAQPGDVLRQVIRHAGALTALGVLCGVPAALFLTRLMQDLLFGVTPLDPVTYAAVVLALAAVALAASYVPARRASRIDPMAALRCE